MLLEHKAAVRVTYPNGKTKPGLVTIRAWVEDDLDLRATARGLINYTKQCQESESPFQLKLVLAQMACLDGYGVRQEDGNETELLAFAGIEPNSLSVYVS